MAGTIEGGRKAAQANLAKNPNFYREIGARGGSVSGIKKGFGLSHERAVAAGRLGGSISRRAGVPNKPKTAPELPKQGIIEKLRGVLHHG